MDNLSYSQIRVIGDPFEWACNLLDMGFSGWEICGEGDHAINESMVRKVKEAVGSTDLTISVHAPFSDINMASVNDPIWEVTLQQIIECIELASEITSIVVVHPGYLSPLGSQMPDRAFQKLAEGLKKVCDAAEEYDMLVCVENMVNIYWMFGRDPDSVKRIVEAVNRENLGVTLDIGHANTTSTLDEYLSWECIHLVRHLHIHDNHGELDEHLALGRGSIDWQTVFKTLEAYDGMRVMELRTIPEAEESIKYIESLEQSSCRT